MREIISIGIGQCGVHLGHEIWRQYNSEHDINEHKTDDFVWQKVGPSKKKESRGEEMEQFYAQTQSGQWVPRNIFVDTSPKAIDSIRNSESQWMYPDSYLLSNKQDACNNFAAGYYTIGKEMIDEVNEAVRTQVEQCDDFQGFIVTHSVGGGTGSGLGALILERLAVDYRKKAKDAFEVYPSPVLSSSVLEPYNALLSTHWSLDYTEVSVVLDNEALYELCQARLDIKRPTYHNLNRLVTKAISSITSPYRFEGELNVDLNELQTNLVLFPRLHFLITSFMPLTSLNQWKPEYSDVQRVSDCQYKAHNWFCKIPDYDPEEDKMYSICQYYRGDVKAKEANATVQWLKANKKLSFVEWGPTGFKVSLNEQRIPMLEEDGIASGRLSSTMLINNVCINRYFSDRVWKTQDRLYSKRAYVHWFIAEGMEERELEEAREDLGFLIKDYLDTIWEPATDEAEDED